MAFETIVRRHNRLLFRTARGVVPDDAEAQDVVQETYLRAFTNLHAYRGDSSLGTWLARIAINVALSSQRKKGRFVQLEDAVPPAGAADPENAMPLHMPDHEGPDAMAERQEMRALLQASIEDLPVIYRSVFILRAVEELSVEETAFCLGVSEDVVKTRFLRARAMLRDKLSRAGRELRPGNVRLRRRPLRRRAGPRDGRAGAPRPGAPALIPDSHFLQRQPRTPHELLIPPSSDPARSRGAAAPWHSPGPCSLPAPSPCSAGVTPWLPARSPATRDTEGDVRILNTALGAELEAIAAYQVGAESGLLTAP